MLASTLIRHLQKQIDEHGDLPVFTGHPTGEYPVNNRVTEVHRIHAGEKSNFNGMFYSYWNWPDCIRLKARE